MNDREKALEGAAEMLWTVLANVSGGNWTKQDEEWQKAAVRWRDNYYAALALPKKCTCHHAYCRDEDLWRAEIAKARLAKNPLADYNIKWVDVDGSEHTWPCESHRNIAVGPYGQPAQTFTTTSDNRVVKFDAPAAPATASSDHSLNQRMWDLVRYKRQELHTDGLITDDEYALLAQDHAAVKRLEDYDAAIAAVRASAPAAEPSDRGYIDIVFDGPPGPECGRFVEVEDQLGRGMKLGEWLQREDGYWVIRVQRAEFAAVRASSATLTASETAEAANGHE